MGARLAAASRYIGVESDQRSAAIARKRVADDGCVVEGTVEELAPDVRVELICAFEVLEHIADDVGALSLWRDRLVPGGFLLLSVPAYQRRFSDADRLVGHYRRYEREDLVAALEAAGYTVHRVEGYGLGLGHLLEVGRNLIVRQRRATNDVGTSGSGRLYQPGNLVGVFTMLVAAPGRVLQRLAWRSELGVGWIALAQRSLESP